MTSRLPFGRWAFFLLAALAMSGPARAADDAAPPSGGRTPAPPPGPGPRAFIIYMDFGVDAAAAALPRLRDWARGSAAEDGAGEVTPLEEISRPERYAVIETWRDAHALAAHRTPDTQGPPLIVAPGQVSPPDERTYEAVSLAPAASAPRGAIYVLVHIDVAPPSMAQTIAWLTAEAEVSRAAGAVRYDVWRQSGTRNHFTVIQAWPSRAAYAAHIQGPASRAFRAHLLTVIGALYDERLYQAVNSGP